MLEEEPEEIALFRQDQSSLSTATKLLRPLSLSLKASPPPRSPVPSLPPTYNPDSLQSGTFITKTDVAQEMGI